jgi:nucleoside 2-deoxyribosyltransferase
VTRKTKIYLAGPMRGYPEYNFPAFAAAAEKLRSQGYEVWSPHERDLADGFDPKTDEALSMSFYMKQDLPAVCDADWVAVLPGWEESEGVQIELGVARALGKLIVSVETGNPIDTVRQPNVAQEADGLVNGDRQATYGHPSVDFGRTADFWTTRLQHKLADGERITSADVPALLRLLKESRLVESPRHRDSLVDICGYALTQEMVWDVTPAD